MKKLVSIFLAIVMVLALSIPALATEDDQILTTVKINEPQAGAQKNRTYAAYRLLDLSVSHKATTGHDYECPVDKGTSTEHADDCYNYSYTISNQDYLKILQKEVYLKTETPFWTELQTTKPEQDDITVEHIKYYLSKLIGDTGSNYNTLRKAADRIYKDIQTMNLTADKTLTATEGTNVIEAQLEQGYWMFVDITELEDGYNANSVVLLATNAKNVITINPKTSLPEVEKKVKDTDDSDNASMLDHAWQDAADHDIGDAIPFKLTATLPTNMDSFETYKMVFHDSMDAGLTIDPSTIKIYVYDNKVIADADTDMNNSIFNETPVFSTLQDDTTVLLENELYKINIGAAVTNHADAFEDDTDCNFEVIIKNAKEVRGAAAGKVIVITYEATLNENAVLGVTGNTNKVYLEFSNDPYSDATGKTTEDKVKVFTYGLTINKIDEKGHKLLDAGFTLKKFSAKEGKYVDVGEEIGGKDSGVTTFIWKGLDDGDYMLEETTVPYGFNKMDPITFTIIATHTVNGVDPELEGFRTVAMGEGSLENGMLVNDVVNYTGTVLPETGAAGTMWIIFGSTTLVILAAVFMITRKKMSVYED